MAAVNEFVAGTLAGAILGLSLQAYWLLVISNRARASSEEAQSRTSTIIIFGGLLGVVGWMLMGGLLGLLVGAIRPEDNDAVLVPSAAYLLVLLFLAALIAIPALVLLSNWKRHVLMTLIMLTGLLGLLLPNLVVAVQS